MRITTDMVREAGYVLLAILQDTIFGLSVYQSVMSFFGFFHKRKPPLQEPKTRFAVLVPAHNEGHVISDVLDSLARQTYPRNLYDVYVVADNCTDDTADVARQHGGLVYERSDTTLVGKGHAIGWLMDCVRRSGRHYDMIAMFDADNAVSPNFLQEVDRYYQTGHRAVQGYLDIKNPGDNWISLSYAIGYWYTNRFLDLARSNMGLAAMLGGTGSCMAVSLIDEIGWNPHSITEDLEFTIQCVLHGVHPVWAWDARVYDEKPTIMKVSWYQRIRWMRGHFSLAFQYSGALWKRFFKRLDMASFDMLVYLGQPVWMVFSYLLMFFYVGVQLSHITSIPRWASAGSIAPWIWAVLSLLEWFAPPMLIASLVFERVKPRYWWGIIPFAIYGLTYIPIDFIALFSYKDQTWFHTIHKRARA